MNHKERILGLFFKHCASHVEADIKEKGHSILSRELDPSQEKQ